MESISALPLIACDALVEGQARACDVATAAGPRRLILVRRGGKTRAYLNSCPHQGVRLDWQPGVLLDVEGEHLQCSMHGARFRLGDGYCVAGPCAGRALLAIPLDETDGVLRVAAGAHIPARAR
jgi:nitrite reductase/ring-hydroxylating ferredoxin subunit